MKQLMILSRYQHKTGCMHYVWRYFAVARQRVTKGTDSIKSVNWFWKKAFPIGSLPQNECLDRTKLRSHTLQKKRKKHFLLRG